MASAPHVVNGSSHLTTGLGISEDNFGRRQSAAVVRAADVIPTAAASIKQMYLDKPGESSRTSPPISPKTSFPSEDSEAAQADATNSTPRATRTRTREDTLRPSDRAVWRNDKDTFDDRLSDEDSAAAAAAAGVDFSNPTPFGTLATQRARVEAARKRLVAARDTLGASSQETLRLRRDFRDALARVDDARRGSNDGGGGGGAANPSDDDDNISESVSVALEAAAAKPRTGATSAASSSGSRAADVEHDEVRTLLQQARKLSLAPSIALPQHTSTLDAPSSSDKIFRAVVDSTEEASGGALTSASTPEGALGRVALPTLLSPRPPSHPDVPDDHDTDSILEIVTSTPTESRWPPPLVGVQVPGDSDDDALFQEDRRFTLVPSEEPTNQSAAADTEALRAGLRFVLGCYDDLSKRANDSKGLSNAIITSIAQGRTYQPIVKLGASPIEVKTHAAVDGGIGVGGTGNGAASMTVAASSTARSPPLRPRLRSGSILRAFARGKSSLFFDGIGSSSSDGEGGDKVSRWGQRGSGLRSPSRSTQMDFDALPGELVGPSTRLGMARIIPWQEADDQSAAGGRGVRSNSGGEHSSQPSARSRTLSNATSPSTKNRNSRISQNEDGSVLSGASHEADSLTSLSTTLKRAQRDADEARQDKSRMMLEVEQLSEELFAQANELVKQERIRSSALEKERDKLKSALSSSHGGDEGVGAKAAKSGDEEAHHAMDLGAQTESEAMMMAAVAQASRECAEAEEEAQGWRKHCEELEARVAILEEALYNAMAMLSEHEQQQQEGGGGDDVAVGERSGHSSSVMSNNAFSDSVSSFYSAGEDDDIKAGAGDVSGKVPVVAVSTMQSAEIDVAEHHPTTELHTPSPDSERESPPQQDTPPEDSLASVRRRSIMHIDDEVAEAAKGGGGGSKEHPLHEPINGILAPPFEKRLRESQGLSFAHDTGSAASLSSHRSSALSGSGNGSPSRRASVVSSRRLSRSTAGLPPRLPEPSSPLPSLPGEESAGFARADERAVLRRASALSNEVAPEVEAEEEDDFHDVADTAPPSLATTPGLSSALPSPLPELSTQAESSEAQEERQRSASATTATSSAPDIDGKAEASPINGSLAPPRTPQLDVIRRNSLTQSSSGESRRSNTSGDTTSDGSGGGMPRSRSTSYNLSVLAAGSPQPPPSSRTLGRRAIMRAIDSSELVAKTAPASPAAVERHEAELDGIAADKAPSWQSAETENKVVRRRTVGGGGGGGGQRKAGRKSARSAILNHMPPAAPNGNGGSLEGGVSSSKSDVRPNGNSRRASIASSATKECGSFHSSRSTESSLHDGDSSLASPPPEQQRSVSGRRRRFNESAPG